MLLDKAPLPSSKYSLKKAAAWTGIMLSFLSLEMDPNCVITFFLPQ